MGISLNVKYNPSKYENIVDSVRDLYKNHYDPSGFEARYEVAEILSASFPHINKRRAFNDAPRLIEAYTGHKLSPESFVKEFGKTFSAKWEDTNLSMKMSFAMMEKNPEKRARRIQEIREQESGKLPYRSDFKNFGLFTDLVVSSAGIVPSMIPFVGMHAGAAALSPILGPGAFVVSKLAGSAYGGAMEAGSLLRELYDTSYELDGQTYTLPDEEIRAAWLLTMAGTGLINYFTQDFEMMFGKAIGGIFSKGNVTDLIASGAVRHWALRRIGAYAKDIVTESIQESLQELVAMLASNNAKRRTNRDYGTDFLPKDINEIGRVMAMTAVETAKGMILTGMVSQGFQALTDFRSSDDQTRYLANKYSDYTAESFAMPVEKISTHPSAEIDVDFDRMSPARVFKIDDVYRPVDVQESSKVRSAIAKGARALNIQIVDGQLDVDVDRTRASTQAESIASKIDNAKVIDNKIVLDKAEKIDTQARKFVENSNDVVGYRKNEDGSVTLQLDRDGVKTQIEFTSIDLEPDAKVAKSPAIEITPDVFERVRPEKQVRESVKSDFRAFRTNLQGRGATDADIDYLTNNIVERMVDEIKTRRPRMSTDDAYGIAIPSAYFAYLASGIVGVSPEQFFDQHFTVDKFATLTLEQETAFLASPEGRASLDLDARLLGDVKTDQEVVLGGLLQKIDGKWRIALGRGFNAVTLVHELSHTLVDLIKDTDVFKPFLELYSAEVEQDGGIGRAVKERFARDIELYIKDGKMADKGMKRIFDKITKALKDFVHKYTTVLDPDVKAEFDRLFGKHEVIKPEIKLDLESDPDAFIDSVDKNAPRDMTLASIERRLNRETVKEMLARGEYPHDADLDANLGDPDIDWEAQFRRLHNQDQHMTKLMQNAINSVDIDADNNAIINALNESVGEIIDIGEEVGNVDRFIDRMRQQFKFENTEDADKKFVRSLTQDAEVIEVSKRLTSGRDVLVDTDVAPAIYKLADQDKPTDYAIRKARQELRENRTYYRHLLLEQEGNTAQISYEMATYNQFYSGEVSRYSNSEVAKLLSSDLDENIKSLIRRGVANNSTLQYIIDSATDQIESIKAELGLQGESIETLIRMVEEGDTEYRLQNEKLKAVRELNKQNRDRYHSLKRTLKMRTDALKAKAQYEKLLRRGDTIAKPSQNYDANMMHTLSDFWRLMKTNEGGVVASLDDFIVKNNIDIDAFPAEFKQFFEMRDDGVYFSTKMNKMSMADLHYIEALMLDYKKKAADLVEQRKRARDLRISNTVGTFFSNKLDIKGEDKRSQLEQAKQERSINDPRNVKPTFWGTIDTFQLTASRWIKKLDSSLYRWVFGEGGLDDISVKEQGMINQRYKNGSAELKRLGIKPNKLHDELIRLPRKGKFKEQILTNDMGVAVYVYSKQTDGLAKLISPDGNGFTQGEVDTIINKLPSNYKAWGDYIIKDMMSRYDATAKAYYEQHNKRLGFVNDYFPLVSGANNVVIQDLLNWHHDNQNVGPADSHTKERAGGTYPLSLNATNAWYRMVHQQEHYINSSQWVSDTNYMLSRQGGDLFSAIEISSGHEYAKAFQKFVENYANRVTVYDTADNIVNNVRSNLAVARLGFNLITALKQVPSLGYFILEFNPIRLAESAFQLMTDYKGVTERIYTLAPHLEFRSFDHDVDLSRRMVGQTKYQRAVDKIGQIGMKPIQLMDKLVVNTLWNGAYNADIARGLDVESAARNATRFIADTQPGGRVFDTAAIYQTNNAMLQYLLMFTSQLNKNFNIIYADIPLAAKQGQYTKALSYMAGLGLSFAGILLASGGFHTLEDEEDDAMKYVTLFTSQLFNQLPIVGNAMSAIVSGDYYGSDSSLIIPEVNALVKAFKSTKGRDEKVKDAITRLGLSVGEVSGLPSGMGMKVYKAFDDEINLGYLLNSRWADILNE